MTLLRPIDNATGAGSTAPVHPFHNNAFASAFSALLTGTDPLRQTQPGRGIVGRLTAGSNAPVAAVKLASTEQDEVSGVAPTYTAKLPDTRETRRRYFSENTVPMNSIVVTHEPNLDADAGRRIIQAAHKANPNARSALLVQEYDASDPGQLEELAAYYQVPASFLAPVRFEGRAPRNNRAISLFPQDGFIAGAGGLYEPAVGTRHSGDVANVLGNAFGLKVKPRAYIGMGGDTHFLTRPNGEQAAYFGPETILKTMWGLGTAPKDEIEPRAGPDMLFAIGHIMENMVDAGVKLENIAPLGVSGDSRVTYGSILDTMSGDQLKRFRPDILARLREMRDLPLPLVGAGKEPELFGYHTDLLIASPDGIHAYVNVDNIEAHPEWRRQLEFFGYKPVPLPASFEANGAYRNRISYLNWVMGEVNGERVILLPTEADDPGNLTDNDRTAIATIQSHNPEVRVIPIGGNTARSYNFDPKINEERLFGPHCRTNVLPWIIMPNPVTPNPEP